MPRLASKSEAETILRFQGAHEVYRRGINSLAGEFASGIDAELAADRLRKEGYKAHAVTDIHEGTGMCVVGIHG